jgi:hypothetical protein
MQFGLAEALAVAEGDALAVANGDAVALADTVAVGEALTLGDALGRFFWNPSCAKRSSRSRSCPPMTKAESAKPCADSRCVHRGAHRIDAHE